MTDLINISEVSLPISAMSNAFSGLFGGSGSKDYSTMRLLNVQMQMLENMSSKIDVIQTGIEFIIENQEEIKRLIETIPSKTVSELYRKDLEGLFVLMREKIEAYAIERAKNKEKANKIFQPIFNEILTIIQVSRAKIFRLDNYLDLPVVSTCLHFEIFCMVLAEQPRTLIEITLKSYRRWIATNIFQLEKKLDEKRNDRNKLIDDSKILYTYTRETSSDQETYWSNGELFEKNLVTYTVEFTKYNYKLTPNVSDELSKNIHTLLEKSLLKAEDLPSKFEIGNEVWRGNYVFAVNRKNYKTSKPLNIKDQLMIDESEKDLATTDKFRVPVVQDSVGIDLNKINDESHRLILFSSLINVADESIQAIDKFLKEPQSLNKDSILSFGYELEKFSRIYNERAVEWIKFIDEKAEQIEDAEQKAKLKALRDEMDNLKANEKNILLEYKRLEAEIAENMPENLLTAILGTLNSIGRELERGVQNIGRETEIFVHNLGKNLEKAGQDIDEQLRRDFQNTGELFVALEGYVENQVRALGETLTEAELRVREGKIIDALWHLSTDPIKHTEENAFIALQQSSLLNSIASSAVAIYVPYGAAAYAAWFTYKQTGNLELALKTAVITYLTSEGMTYAKEIPDVTKRTLLTSAVAATAIAASGGTEKDIMEGFLKGSALTIASEAYRNMTTLEIEGKAPTQGPLDKQELLKDKRLVFLNKKGEEVLDITKLSREASHVGLDSGTGIFTEKGYPLQMFAKIPYVNDMAYFHDQWCAIEGYGMMPTVVTILPATILTVAGSERPVLEQIIEVINENK